MGLRRRLMRSLGKDPHTSPPRRDLAHVDQAHVDWAMARVARAAGLSLDQWRLVNSIVARHERQIEKMVQKQLGHLLPPPSAKRLKITASTWPASGTAWTR